MKIDWKSFPCLVILTPNNNDRKNHIEKECKKYGLNPIMISAVMKKNNPVYGCLLSHLKCIEFSKKNNYEKVLILEDDVIFKDTLPEYIEDDFDILYLGYNVTDGYRYNKNYLKLKGVFTAHSYILNCNLFDKIINDLKCEWWRNIKNKDLNSYEKKFNWDLHAIDQYYSKIITKRNKTYGIYPMICYQKPSYSSIEKKQVDYTKIMYNNMNIYSKIYKKIILFNPDKSHKYLIKKLRKYFKVFIYYQKIEDLLFDENETNIEEFIVDYFVDIDSDSLISFNNVDLFINLKINSNKKILYIDNIKSIENKHKEGIPLLYNLSKVLDKIFVKNINDLKKLENKYTINKEKIKIINENQKIQSRFIIDYEKYEDILDWYFDIKRDNPFISMEVVKFKKLSEKEINEKMKRTTFYVNNNTNESIEKIAKKNKLIFINENTKKEKIKKLLKINNKKENILKYLLI